jgi:hypothetical protein
MRSHGQRFSPTEHLNVRIHSDHLNSALPSSPFYHIDQLLIKEKNPETVRFALLNSPLGILTV